MQTSFMTPREKIHNESHTANQHTGRPLPQGSTSSFQGPRRKLSLARSLSKTVITGALQRDQKSTTSLSQENDDLDDMYLDELLQTGDKKTRQSKKKNIRASMGFFTLIKHDFKIWYRRWKNKQLEQPLLKVYIKQIESNFGSGIGSLFLFTRWVLVTNLLLSLFWLGLVVLPTVVSFPYENITQPFSLKNCIDGQGAMSQLWVFYGAYTETLDWNYPLALAYLLLIILTYYGTLFAVLKSIGVAGHVNMSTSAVERFKFSMLLFSSWDHSITSGEASLNLSKGISSVLKDNLYEAKASVEEKSRSKKEKYKVYALRMAAWFITVLLIVGGCSAIVFLVIYTFTSMDSETEKKTDFFSVYGPTLAFSLINILVPKCLSMLPLMERYTTGKKELNVTLARVYCLRMANLIALIISLYSSATTMTNSCIGTVIGQEFYKLVIMDTLVDACLKIFMSFGKFFWTKVKTEFNIPAAALTLIYRQGLIWVGTIACPVLPLLGSMSTLIFFSLNYNIVKKTCKPPIKRWNQSRNTSFLMGFLLITLIIIIIPISVVIGSRDVITMGKISRREQSCGPFGIDKPTAMYGHFRRQQVQLIQQIMFWLVSDSALIPAFFILLALLFYQKILFAGEKRHRLVLQAELHKEREEIQGLYMKLHEFNV